MNARVADLTAKQYQPRMERLKEIEADIKSKIEEYCLADEKMEVSHVIIYPRLDLSARVIYAI